MALRSESSTCSAVRCRHSGKCPGSMLAAQADTTPKRSAVLNLPDSIEVQVGKLEASRRCPAVGCGALTCAGTAPFS